MDKDAKIYVAGHRGLVGSAIVRYLVSQGYTNIIGRTSHEVDLRGQREVNDFFASEKPAYVFLAAAKVGGIYANDTYPAEFIYNNIIMESNIIHAACQHGVNKLLFLGSSCIYPKLCPQPIKEEYLLAGPLEPTNEWYAIAKIAGIKLCQAFRKQYGFNAISAMPTNLYGPGDNFHPENSHVIPGMMQRFHKAKLDNLPEVSIWGTGTPRREFLYADDLAEALVFLMQHYDDPEHINVGCGEDVTILELARLIAETVGYKGKLVLDPTKPDGTPQKLLNVIKINKNGWNARTGLAEGLALTYNWFLTNSNHSHSTDKV